MARKRVSQGSLAAALKMSHTAAHRRVQGETPLDVNELAIAADLLGVSIAELVGETPAAAAAS